MTQTTNEFLRDLRGRFISPDTDIMFRIEDAARLLRRKKSAIWLMIRMNDVPLVSVGSVWMIRARDLPRLTLRTTLNERSDYVDLVLTVSSVMRGGDVRWRWS